jgi:hypothetical protein
VCIILVLKDLKPRGGDLVLVEMQPESFEYEQLGFSLCRQAGLRPGEPDDTGTYEFRTQRYRSFSTKQGIRSCQHP